MNYSVSPYLKGRFSVSMHMFYTIVRDNGGRRGMMYSTVRGYGGRRGMMYSTVFIGSESTAALANDTCI